jgi:TPR repeat protein
VEGAIGNYDRALKHFTLGAGNGDSVSLNRIQQMVMMGHASKDDYAEALRLYQVHLDRIRSDERDEAAAATEEWKYY